ncbi:MAG: hypothetical protein ACLQNE_37690 [Thermoguttaceae bacterium]
MFLVEDKPMTNLVFTLKDPRKAGYTGYVIEGVTLDYDVEAVHDWPVGDPAPEPCVGRDPDNPNHYKVFKDRSELQSAGFQPVIGNALVFGRWPDYLRAFHPDLLDDEKWYGQLDLLDDASRRRREHARVPDAPADSSRDHVAAWVAKKHLLADSSIREVWYLPRGSPSEEIRLLELNDRLAGSESKAEAIDFGLDIEGAHFRLFVADITSEQLDEIKHDSSRLPPGWFLDDKTVWRRGA